MIIIDRYERPQTLEDAYQLLISDKLSCIIGGGAFLRLSPRTIPIAIDLSDLSLDYINETDQEIQMGAMTTFGNLERCLHAKASPIDLLVKSVKGIVGVQFKNMATLGGTVYGKYGFSELITALMVLDSSVQLYKNGLMEFSEFIHSKKSDINLKKSTIQPDTSEIPSSQSDIQPHKLEKDILTKIIVQKEDLQTSFQSYKKTAGDFPTLVVAVSRKDTNFKIAVGASPKVACLCSKASEFLKNSACNEADIDEASQIICSEIVFGSDIRASAKYREALCQVFAKRALMEVISC